MLDLELLCRMLLRIYILKLFTLRTVNSQYNGHHRNQDLVSVIGKVLSRELFSVISYYPGPQLLFVLMGCP